MKLSLDGGATWTSRGSSSEAGSISVTSIPESSSQVLLARNSKIALLVNRKTTEGSISLHLGEMGVDLDKVELTQIAPSDGACATGVESSASCEEQGLIPTSMDKVLFRILKGNSCDLWSQISLDKGKTWSHENPLAGVGAEHRKFLEINGLKDQCSNIEVISLISVQKNGT